MICYVHRAIYTYIYVCLQKHLSEFYSLSSYGTTNNKNRKLKTYSFYNCLLKNYNNKKSITILSKIPTYCKYKLLYCLIIRFDHERLKPFFFTTRWVSTQFFVTKSFLMILIKQ